MEKTRKQHWETIYETKKFEEVSWYQAVPEVSLTILSEFGVEKDWAIIDIGGGDSYFVDFLLNQNYTDICVLDISEKALQRVQNRLESKAEKVHWIASDITEFKPSKKYDFWHDRAVFHFLTEPNDVKKYAEIAAFPFCQTGLKRLVIDAAAELGNILKGDFDFLLGSLHAGVENQFVSGHVSAGIETEQAGIQGEIEGGKRHVGI